MNGMDLLDGLGYIDERFVEEAESRTISGAPWRRIAAAAACLCVLLTVLHSDRRGMENATTGSIADADPNQEAQGTIIADSGVDVPSVILYVEAMTEAGLTGTVAAVTDTDLFEIGAELKVVLLQERPCDTADGKHFSSIPMGRDYSGCYIVVQFIDYDTETGTIVAEGIMETTPPESAP